MNKVYFSKSDDGREDMIDFVNCLSKHLDNEVPVKEVTIKEEDGLYCISWSQATKKLLID